MKNHESKYFYTASLMNDALLILLEKKEYDYITIKDICEKAGVNRSTFYLHYQNIDDLLVETIENAEKKLLAKYDNYQSFKIDKNTKKEDLFMFTKEYVLPYLDFLKENKRIYILANKKKNLLRVDQTTSKLYTNFLSKVLEKFEVPENERKYIISFFMSGIHAIINTWLKNDCKDSEEFIADLIYRYTKKD